MQQAFSTLPSQVSPQHSAKSKEILQVMGIDFVKSIPDQIESTEAETSIEQTSLDEFCRFSPFKNQAAPAKKASPAEKTPSRNCTLSELSACVFTERNKAPAAKPFQDTKSQCTLGFQTRTKNCHILFQCTCRKAISHQLKHQSKQH